MPVLVRTCIAVGVLGLICCASPLQAQTAPAVQHDTSDPAMYALIAFFQQQLGEPQYQGMDPYQRMAVTLIALSAAVLIDSSRCADPDTANGAGWVVGFILSPLGGKAVGRRFHSASQGQEGAAHRCGHAARDAQTAAARPGSRAVSWPALARGAAVRAACQRKASAGSPPVCAEGEPPSAPARHRETTSRQG